MYRFRSIKYCTTTALMSALLALFGFGSFWAFGKWISIAIGNSAGIIQLFDGLLVALTALIPGPMMLVAGIIAGILVDLMIATGVSLVALPMTIVVRVLMFVIIKMLLTIKWYSCLWTFFLALLTIVICYPLYDLVLYGPAKAILAVIGDSVQSGISYVIGITLYWRFHAIQIHSKKGLWDDSQFDSYKKKRTIAQS